MVAIQRGRDSLTPINYSHVIRTSIVMAISYLFGVQQNHIFRYLSMSDDVIDVDSVQVGAGLDFELLINSLTFECRNPQLPGSQTDSS